MNRNSRISNFIKTLQSRNITMAFAESMTCGLAAHMLSTCKGTAEVLKGSVVCYSPEVKEKLLKVPATLIDKFSAESKEVTAALARNLPRVIKADVHAAITGLAAPGGSERPGKPPGTVFFAIRYKGRIHHHRQVFRGTPLQIREKSVLVLYELMLKLTRPEKTKKSLRTR